MRRLHTWVADPIGWTIIWAGILLFSFVYHLAYTEVGRRAGTDVLNLYVSSVMTGTLEAGRIDHLGTDYIIVRHTALLDPDGDRIITADRIKLVLDYEAAMMGTLRFSHAHLSDGYVRLIDDGEGTPTFINSFNSPDPSPDDGEPGLHAIVDDMHLDGLIVYGEILGLENLRIEDLYAHGRLEVEEELEILIWDGGGRIVSPVEEEATLDRAVGRISGFDHEGSQIYARAHRGEERLVVNFDYHLPEDAGPDDDWYMNLEMHAYPLEASTVHEVGFDWASILTGTMDGHIRLHGPTDDLRLDGQLDTDGGEVELEGSLPSEGDIVLHARGESWQVDRIIDGFPALEAGGEVTLTAEDDGDETVRLRLDMDTFVYDDFPVPSLRVHVILEEDAARITGVRAPHLDGEITGGGRVYWDGRVNVRLRGHIDNIGRDPRVSMLMPGSRGSLDFDVRVQSEAGQEGYDNNGYLRFRNLRYAGVSADAFSIDGHLWGEYARPNLDADIRAEELEVGGYPLGSGTGIIRGGPTTYTTSAAFRATGGRLVEFDANVGVHASRYEVEVPSFRLTNDGLLWQGTLTGLTYSPDRLLEVENLEAHAGDQLIAAHGRWTPEGDDTLRLTAENLDLSTLPSVFGDAAPEMEGQGSVRLEVVGDLDGQPQILAEGNLSNATYRDIEGIHSSYRVRYEAGELAMDGHLSVLGSGTFTLRGTGYVDPDEEDLATALYDGLYDLELGGDQLELSLLDRFFEDVDIPVTGKLNGVVYASGMIEAPTFEGQVNIPDLRLPFWDPIEMSASVDYRRGSFIARLETRDEDGELFEAEGSLAVDVVHLVREIELADEIIANSLWRFGLRLPDRRVDTLPDALIEGLPTGVRDLELSLSMNLAGGAFEPRGSLDASIELTSDLSEEVCGRGSRPRAQITADINNNESLFEVETHVGDARVLHLIATARTPINEWLLGHSELELPITDAELNIDGAPLGEIPIACAYASGEATGRVWANGLFGPSPEAGMTLISDAFRARWLQAGTRHARREAHLSETPPVGLEVSAAASHGEMTLSSRLVWWTGGMTEIFGTAPIQWTGRNPIPELSAEGEVDGRLEMLGMPLEAALAWVPGMSATVGRIDGEMRVGGTVQEPSFDGELGVSEGRVELHTLGQRLRGVQGRLIFEEDRIRLSEIQAHDDDGRADMEGEIELEGITPRRAGLDIDADRFPIREEGSIIARLSGEARADAKITDDLTLGALDVVSLMVRLPEDIAVSPQGLAHHPDVHLVDEIVDGEIDPEEPYRMEMDVQAPSFSVSRSDFDSRVSADLAVTYADPEFRVKGNVVIHGGYFEIFGKRFTVQEGQMVFDGEDDLDPVVELVAVHQLRSEQGESVTVRASGTLSHPEITFSSRLASTQAEVIALLLGGDRRNFDASQASSADDARAEASQFLTGLAFGVLSLSLKEEFGAYVPTIVLETGDSGTGAQIRVGVDVENYVDIPDGMSRVIQGIYFEGYYGTGGRAASSSSSSATAQDFGFLLELRFPRNIVGTTTYSPLTQGWSVDATWQP